MNNSSMNKLAASGGLISLFFMVIGWFIYGNGPTVADSPEDILTFFTNSHDQVIWSMFAQGLGALAMIWFMAALVISMRDESESLLASAMAISFAIALALGSAATIMRSGIAFISVGDVTPDTVAVIFYLGSVIDTGQNMISAGIYLAFAMAVLRTKFLPVWWGWLSITAGLYAVISTTALDHSGFWSPHEAGFLNLIFYIVWTGGTSLLLLRRLHSTHS